jgi:ribosomal protein S14
MKLIQCRRVLATGWTRMWRVTTIRRMPSAFHIEKLSDEFGQYTLVLKCSECGHERKADPLTLGRLCGWDARLEDVAKRMRCSKCGKKRCVLRAFPPKKPRGYSALPRKQPRV